MSTTATLFDRQYSYNSANQISQIIEPSLSRVFGYDNIDRLTTVTGGVSENYVFDSVGNRTSSHKSSNYGYQPFNKIASTQTAIYGSDANGNMTTKGEGSNFWRYSWDYENRMTEASTRKNKVRYRYDALGRRVSRGLGYGKEQTKFTYDGQDVLVDDNFGTQTKYLNGAGIDNKLRQTTGSTTSYFLADHLGSTNGLANSSGALTASNSYDSFGNPTNTVFSSRYQFTGREFDSFSGLQLSRARWYDPNLGRFISEDPIGFEAGDVNLYGYVGNDPLNYYDPMGLDGWPTNLANWFDENIEYARQFYQGDEQDWQRNGTVNTVADLASGASDMLRCGSGFGQAYYSTDENIYGRAASATMDVARCAALAAALLGPLSKAVPGTRPPVVQGEACPPGRFPNNPAAMDDALGFPGRRIPDRPETPGRNKVEWKPSDKTKITFEQHPYHPNAGDFHKKPHWHVDTPGRRHKRYLPGDPFP